MNLTEEEQWLKSLLERNLTVFSHHIDCSGPVAEGATQCEDSILHRWLLGYGFILVFCLAMFGNCLNLLIYNSDHIRYYLAIRMLCTRLLMNTLTVLSLLPQSLRLMEFWKPDSRVEMAYWAMWPYISFFGNLFGFCAMWLTVLMVGECYLHVFLPARSKAVCTHMNLRKCYVLLLAAGTTLAIIYPVNRSANITRDSCNRIVVFVESTFDSSIIQVWESVHTIANLLVALLIPLCLLVFMTLAICWKVQWRAVEQTKTHFSSEKRSVTRLTLITTGLQLFDFPSVYIFFLALMKGPAGLSSACSWYSFSLFLGLCNMSLSFYVYLIFSPRFRNMVAARFTDVGSMLLPCIPFKDRRPLPMRTPIKANISSAGSAIFSKKSSPPSQTYIEEERLTARPDSFL